MNQRNGRLAAAESRYVRDARELLRHALHLFRYFLRGNFQFQLAPAACFSHATVLSLDDDRSSNETSAGLGGMRPGSQSPMNPCDGVTLGGFRMRPDR